MKLDLRVRLLDLVMRLTGMHISDAADLEAIQRLRDRRREPAGGPLGAIVAWIGNALFGRPHRGVTIEERTVPGPAGPLRVRLYRPRRPSGQLPLVVNIHGGGFVLGDVDGNDWVCSTVAGEVGALVASVAYRLAPEDPAPAAVEDAVAATTWLAEHRGELGAPGPIAVMGDSAGGNLATLVAIAARDAGGPTIALQVLMYPATDLTMSFPSANEHRRWPVLTRDDMDAFVGHYLGADGDPRDPRLSPWFVEDLAGLAPALVQTAEHDPLRDEGRAYADRLRDAGVEVRFTEYAGMPHGFVSLPGACRSARQAVAEAVQELRRRLR